MDTQTSWFIIASGPSLTAEDVESLRGQHVLCVNDNYRMAPFADAMYASDPQWWEWHAERPELKAFKGRKVTQDKEAARKYGLEYIEGVDEPGLSRDPARIHTGANSGIAAINLAAHWTRRIVLLGFDMQGTGGKAHWFGNHPGCLRTPPADWWHKWLWRYELVARDAESMGLSIINCSRATALRCFERKTLEEVLTGCAISS